MTTFLTIQDEALVNEQAALHYLINDIRMATIEEIATDIWESNKALAAETYVSSYFGVYSETVDIFAIEPASDEVDVHFYREGDKHQETFTVWLDCTNRVHGEY